MCAVVLLLSLILLFGFTNCAKQSFICNPRQVWGRFMVFIDIPISIILLCTMVYAACNLHCISNVTLIESEEYKITDIDNTDRIHQITYVEDGIMHTLTVLDVYDVREIKPAKYDTDGNPLSYSDDYAVRIAAECNSPEIIQKIANFSVSENQIRVYTSNPNLLAQYEVRLLRTDLSYTIALLMIAGILPVLFFSCNLIERNTNSQEDNDT